MREKKDTLHLELASIVLLKSQKKAKSTDSVATSPESASRRYSKSVMQEQQY